MTVAKPNRKHGLIFLLLFSTLTVPSVVCAQRAEPISTKPPKTALPSISIFDKSFRVDQMQFTADKVTDVSDAASETNKAVDRKQASEAATKVPEKENKLSTIEFQGGDPKSRNIPPPEENPSILVNPDSPAPVLGMIDSYRRGDEQKAGEYADQFVRYVQNYFFEVRKITQLFGQALVRQHVISEDDWVGVGQYIDYEMAKTRKERNIVIKPTQEVAMKRIKADEKHEAEIYYFFTMNCSWCRYMAPDVERLWRVAQRDPKVKMTALTLEDVPEDWITEYRRYTGLSVPIFDGKEAAKKLDIGFVPALVIVSPTGKHAYKKTGQQTFERMYEFLRTVQGLPVELSGELLRLVEAPIGEAEIAQAKGNPRKITVVSQAQLKTDGQPKTKAAAEKAVAIEKF